VAAPTLTDPELKARHRAMWASGDYPSMVTTFLLPLGPRLVAACEIGPGMRVLDVGAGTGNASLPAARLGARVTASDLTPELLDAGRARAESEGLELEWVPADAEHLPSTTRPTTWSSPRSARCSHRTTRMSRTSWSGSPARAAPSGC
jgi:SAM-dependent methyltransferase